MLGWFAGAMGGPTDGTPRPQWLPERAVAMRALGPRCGCVLKLASCVLRPASCVLTGIVVTSA
eukprot:11839793-Alexandrium_andersonii.AAC.1